MIYWPLFNPYLSEKLLKLITTGSMFASSQKDNSTKLYKYNNTVLTEGEIGTKFESPFFPLFTILLYSKKNPVWQTICSIQQEHLKGS